jgi:hypothetical protein
MKPHISAPSPRWRPLIILGTVLIVSSCTQRPTVTLPNKVFTKLSDDGLRVTGHWALRTAETSLPPSDGHFAANPLNSTIIHCRPTTRRCEEYRATIASSDSLLLSLDPMIFSIVSWDPGQVVATWTTDPGIECILRIDRMSQEVEMEYRRQPSPGHSRVFERWVLE